MSTYEALKLDNQLCFALYTCAREITRLYRPHLDELGLTYTQYITMLVLWETPNIRVKDLGERLFLDSGTLTPLLKKLEKAGLIERQRDPADERSVIVSLTPKGTELQHAAAGIPEKIFCSSGLEPKEALGLRDQLKKAIRQINS
jgi:DNA-binding MarR family transcriptional regulator